MRVAFEQAGDSEAAVPVPSPQALVGTAVHRALELMIGGLANLDEAWATACDELRAQGDVEVAPGATRARLRLSRKLPNLLEYIEKRRPAEILLEQWVESSELQLGGRIDLLILGAQTSVVDYKTGLVTDDGEPHARYERQLAIYSALVAAARGISDVDVALFSLREGLVPLTLSVAERDAIVASVLAARDTYNARCPGAQVATPSQESCHWCPYVFRCDPAWEELASGRMESIGWGEAVEGHVSGSPAAAANGAWAIALQGVTGTVTGDAVIVDVPHDVGARVREGDPFACVGLATRSDEPLVLGWHDGITRGGLSSRPSTSSTSAA